MKTTINLVFLGVVLLVLVTSGPELITYILTRITDIGSQIMTDMMTDALQQQ